MKTFTTQLTTRKQVSPETYMVTFSVKEGGLEFDPGQYMIMKIPQEGKIVNRLYSIASSNTQHDSFELFVKQVPGGVGSVFLTTAPLGSEIACMGPAGLFRLKESEKQKVFMTTGTGFAPIRSILLSQQTNPPVPWLLLWGDQHLSDVGLFDELLDLQQRLPSFSFYACLSREKDLSLIPAQFQKYCRLGRINNVFDDIKSQMNLANLEFYMCGSRVVVEGLKSYLSSLSLPAEQIIFEKY
jgi:ferredoxin-NADP reductase